MINLLLITLLPVVDSAWLNFESMGSCVLGKSDRSRVDPIADSGLGSIHPFLPLNSPPTPYTLLKPLSGPLASPPISNPLYNPHRTR
jgi:hypothetical protein